MTTQQTTAISPSPETEQFWQAARESRLLLKACNACGAKHFYPRSYCPHCFSDDLEWAESAGRGSVYSFSVMRRVERPYAIAYVTLDEGISLISNLVNVDLDEIVIGQRVTVVYQERDGKVLPMFEPESMEPLQ